MAITQRGQIDWGGITVGEGTAYPIVEVDGIVGLPDVRTVDADIPRRHGAWSGEDLYGGRTIRIDIGVDGDIADYAAYNETVRALRAACQARDSETPLTHSLFGDGDEMRQAWVRPRRADIRWDTDAQLGAGRATVDLFAPDPRWYSPTETTLTLEVSDATGGLSFPAVFPLDFGGSGGGINAATITNSGDFDSPPALRIWGPCVHPRLLRVAGSDEDWLEIAETIETGHWIDVDMFYREVLYDGVASRYGSVTAGSVFWTLQPGANTVAYFTGDAAASPGSTVRVAYRSAWI